MTKWQLTQKVVEFVSKDIRTFDIVTGDRLKDLAYALINVGVEYGQVPAADVLPYPLTSARNLAVMYSDVEDNVEVPEIRSLFSVYGGGVTYDMWTSEYN